MNDKFELVKENSIVVKNRALRQIRALKNFGDVKKGDLGGYVQDESNLSPDGDSWIYDRAAVYGGSTVSESAKVYQNAHVFNQSQISGRANIFGDSQVSNSKIGGLMMVHGNAILDGVEKNDDETIDGSVGGKKGKAILIIGLALSVNAFLYVAFNMIMDYLHK